MSVYESRLGGRFGYALARVPGLGPRPRRVRVPDRRAEVRPGGHARGSHRAVGGRWGEVRPCQRPGVLRALQHGTAYEVVPADRTRPEAGIAVVLDSLNLSLPFLLLSVLIGGWA